MFQYDADSFAAEAARIEETPGLDSSLPDCIEAGGKTYYLVNGEADGFYGFSSCCDDETLDGKPYCMDIAASDGGIFGATKIQIRGASTLKGNNQPIYVISA